MEGATLTRLRCITTAGPLHAGPLLSLFTALLTRVTFLTALDNLEIGKLAAIGVSCVHFPSTPTRSTEELGGETAGQETEFEVHEATCDREDLMLGARVKLRNPIPHYHVEGAVPLVNKVVRGKGEQGCRLRWRGDHPRGHSLRQQLHSPAR